MDDIIEVWSPGYMHAKKKEDVYKAQKDEGVKTGDFVSEVNNLTQYPTAYIVVGPVSNHLQMATGEQILDIYIEYV